MPKPTYTDYHPSLVGGLLHDYYTIITRLLHEYYTIIARLLHVYYTISNNGMDLTISIQSQIIKK